MNAHDLLFLQWQLREVGHDVACGRVSSEKPLAQVKPSIYITALNRQGDYAPNKVAACSKRSKSGSKVRVSW